MVEEEVNIGSLGSDDTPNNKIVWKKDEVQKRRFYLKGYNIGISISESDNLEILGFSKNHLDDALIEISRYLLSLGGNIVYGGDLRKDGFTTLLFDLVDVYKDFENPSEKRLINFLSWPLSLELTKEHRLKYKGRVTFNSVNPPNELAIQHPNEFIDHNSIANRVIWARCLTAMREEMNASCQARILLGGSSTNFIGVMPGILEELLLCIRHDKPVYLLGCYGGITQEICRFLMRETDVVFNISDEYAEFIKAYNLSNPQVNIEQVYLELQSYGIERIIANSGLNKAEYVQMMMSPNIIENIFFILRGLISKIS